jgi:integrase
MATELTDKLIKTLPAPAKGNRITYDTEARGLGVRVTSAGARAFVFNYRTKAGTERRITIGGPPAWDIAKARKEARALRLRVDGGGDPMGAMHSVREAPTLADLAARFETEHLTKRRPSTVRDYKAMLQRHVLPAFGSHKVAAIQAEQIEALHAKIAKSAPYVANRVAAVLSKMFKLAVKWRMRTDNPVSGIERSPEEKRQRYLSPAEIIRLSEALAAHPERGSANAVRLLLLTGARRGEMLSATWDQFDFALGAWTKPGATTKQKTDHRIPLSAPALQLLVEMKTGTDKENERRALYQKAPVPFLFPGKDGEPQTDIKHFWASICRTAKIEGVRVHDLRHTHASILASLGLSLPIIGALLGHTQAATTHRYAHLMDDPLRAATERLGAVVTGGATGGVVVPIAAGRSR